MKTVRQPSAAYASVVRIVSPLALVAVVLAAFWPAGPSAATQPNLGTALNYAVLAGSAITNTGPSVIEGNLGLDPGTSVTGMTGPPTNGLVIGSQDIHPNAAALQAKTDLGIGYGEAASAPTTLDLTGQDLGNMNLGPGVYSFSSSAQLTGALTLTGNGVFIFKIGSTLTTASNSSVLLAGLAQACAVYWQVGSSATLGTGTLFQGTLMAMQSITLNTGANIITGRALARVGALTLDNNHIVAPSGTCSLAAGASPTPSGGAGASPTPSGGAGASPTPSGGAGASPTPSGGAGASPTPSVATTTTPTLTAPGTTPTPSVTPRPTPTPTLPVRLPDTGAPPPQAEFPWWPLAAAVIIGALLLGLSVRPYRRDS